MHAEGMLGLISLMTSCRWAHVRPGSASTLHLAFHFPSLSEEGGNITQPWQPTRLTQTLHNGFIWMIASVHHQQDDLNVHSSKAGNDVPGDHGLGPGPHKPSHDT